LGITQEQLTQLNNSIKSNLKPAFAMAGIANPISASILFGVDVIFRFVTLGTQIRKLLQEAQKSLEETVRSEGIFRVPVEVDITYSEVLGFFTKGNCQILYPMAYHQFKREREILVDKTNPGWQEAFDTLRFAYRILPEVYLDYKFDKNSVLDDLFGKWLDPGDPDFRSLVKEIKLFYTREETSISDLMQLLPEYSKLKLELMGVRLDLDTENTLEDLNSKIQDLVQTVVFGDEGMVKVATSFAVKQRIEQIENQITNLEEQERTLEEKPEQDRSEAERKELKQIKKRTDELEQMKERIESVATG